MPGFELTDSFGVEVFTFESSPDTPGVTWKLSPETEQTLRDIDDNIRSAELEVGTRPTSISYSTQPFASKTISNPDSTKTQGPANAR